MTTRRRLLGAMTALGLLPGTALARQAANPQQYQCVKNVGTALPQIHVDARGTMNNPTYALGKYKMGLSTDALSTAKGMTGRGDGPTGYIEFIFERLDPKDPAIFMTNMTALIRNMDYDAPLDAFAKKNLTVTFTDLAGQPMFSLPANLKAYSAEPVTEACVEFDMLEHYSGGTFEKSKDDIFRTHKHFMRLIEEAGSYIILFNDPAKGMAYDDAIVKYMTFGQAVHRLPKIMMDQINPQVDKIAAGECPELSGPCFLTTAASHALGLPDDCWELETLRTFRDGPLQDLPGGVDLIERYYAEAPMIVKKLPVAEHKRLWARTWLTGVLPAAIFCRLGWNGAALKIYRRMFERLSSA